MKRFIIKTIVFAFGLTVTSALAYYCSNSYLNYSFRDKNAVFIWGDSQTYQGIDIEELSNTIDKRVYTSAQPGAGVYDFLLFTKQVPDNSIVIVSISKLVQIRRKKNDYNRSGLSLWSLSKLYQNNYSLIEIISIAELNLKPKNNITSTTQLFPYSDSINIAPVTLTNFKSYYQEIPDFLDAKQNLYLTGIKNLINKNCKISFIEFPYHKDLENIENQSPIKKKINDFKLKVASLFSEFQICTIKIRSDKNIFQDLSHLNCVGAQDLSKKLGVNLFKHKQTTLYIAL